MKKKKEVILFKNKIKSNLSKLDLKLYILGILVEENLNWKKHVNDISHKLIQSNTVLSKIRNSVNKGTLRTIYFAMFYSYINYVPMAWENTNYLQQRISLL